MIVVCNGQYLNTLGRYLNNSIGIWVFKLYTVNAAREVSVTALRVNVNYTEHRFTVASVL